MLSFVDTALPALFLIHKQKNDLPQFLHVANRFIRKVINKKILKSLALKCRLVSFSL